jgi:transcriptional regulator with XRE-family HTH domain
MSKNKNKMLTPAETEELLSMYVHRLKLLEEARQYSIEGLARRFGCSKNTIWSRTCGLIGESLNYVDDSYTQRLVKHSAALKEQIDTLKADISQLITKCRVVEACWLNDSARDRLSRQLHDLVEHAVQTHNKVPAAQELPQ